MINQGNVIKICRPHLLHESILRNTKREGNKVTHLETAPMDMNTHPKIQNLLDTLPTFITEMDADWDMVTDYVMSQIQPTYMEWVEIGKVFDDTLS